MTLSIPLPSNARSTRATRMAGNDTGCRQHASETRPDALHKMRRKPTVNPTVRAIVAPLIATIRLVRNPCEDCTQHRGLLRPCPAGRRYHQTFPGPAEVGHRECLLSQDHSLWALSGVLAPRGLRSAAQTAPKWRLTVVTIPREPILRDSPGASRQLFECLCAHVSSPATNAGIKSRINDINYQIEGQEQRHNKQQISNNNWTVEIDDRVNDKLAKAAMKKWIQSLLRKR